MPKPCYRIRENEAGVSEVFGTLLILAMTTVLFATIIIWVSNIPTPAASTKLDMEASYSPIYLSGNGANITIRHKGGENVQPDDARLYLTITRAGIPSTTVLKLEGTYPSGPLTGRPYGLVDGQDATWNIGERWQWSNYSTLPTDTISAILVDLTRNRVMWSGDVLGAPGTHPPIFLEKWADRVWTTPTADTPWTGVPFHVMARMADADSDLVRINATLTIFFGQEAQQCSLPQGMTDDGTNGDLVPGDGIWTLYRTCMDRPGLAWDGSVVLFNATDAKGHYTSSRLILSVEPNPGGDSGGFITPDTGRPPNLRYNGLQGYNLFNGTEWTDKGFDAVPTRTFKENEQVVVLVGSLLLADTRGTNQFMFSDPYSGIPPDPVVYGPSKTVTLSTRPSNNQAFTYYTFVNGYNVFIYTFDLNNPSTVGTNFYTSPPPSNYKFGRYPLAMTIVDSTGAQFVASDAINVTDVSGNMPDFPLITTFFDSGFTGKATEFQSTDVIYVQVSFQDTGPVSSVVMGNVIIRDFEGGTPVFKAPINGRDANAPLCPATGACSGNIFSAVGAPANVYRFAINLSLANQDGWVDGIQTYSLTISTIRDASAYDQYSNLAISIIIAAPLYRLDLAVGNIDTLNSAWQVHEFSFLYTAVNGVDRWRKDRLLYGPKLTPDAYTKAIRFFDYDQDSDADVAASVVNWPTGSTSVFLFRQDLDSFGNPVYTRFTVKQETRICNDIATGDVTADGNPEIVCGGANGQVWYYRNDGQWSTVNIVDNPVRTSPVNAIDLGDFDGDGALDIAAARNDGKVTYYLNLDRQGGFVNAPLTDDWISVVEVPAIGTVTFGSHFETHVSDQVRESIREATVTEGAVGGATANGDFATSSAGWAFLPWENAPTATGSFVVTGGNTTGYVNINMPRVPNDWVSGYWYQPFQVSGAGPWTATVTLNYRFLQPGSQFIQLILYAFVDKAIGAPVLADAAWSTTLAATGPWTASPSINAGSKITGPGTYYLKVAARAQYGTNTGPNVPTIAGFDDVNMTWSSSAGQVSELEHYWRIQQLPSRSPSTYTLNIEGLASASPDGDTFSVAYAVESVASPIPPPGSAFTAVADIATATEQLYTATLPSTLASKIVWVRVVDTNRFVDNDGTIDNDTVSVDRLFVQVASSGSLTGADIDPDSVDTVAITAIDADDRQGDGFADLVVGSANGKIYRLQGSPGGLISFGFWKQQGSSPIVGIKWVNATLVGLPSLEIAFATGSNAYVITGDGTATDISGARAAGGTASALTAGDIDGDGDDDLVVATSTGGLRYWRNLGGATPTAWSAIDLEGIPVQIYDLDLGDMSNAAYRGR